MAKNIKKLADQLGGEIVARLPETGGVAFGAARLAQIVSQLQSRLRPSQGLRQGRPTVSAWDRHPKVPMSRATEQRLIRLAAEASNDKRKVSPMQLAAQILENALEGIPEH
jgi:hypothetical protein